MSTQHPKKPDPVVGVRRGEGDAKPTSTGQFVTVGCKLAAGFIMEIGSREEDTYWSMKLNGVNSARVIGGFGITEGVPAERWEVWAKKMERFKMMKNGLIFKMEGKADEASWRDAGKEMKDQKTGTERLDPRNLPNEFRDPATGKLKVEPRTL